VTEHEESDEALRKAFQALGETAREETSPADLDLVWRAVSGELPAPERRQLVERLATEPALAESWRVADELWRAAPASNRATTRQAWFLAPSWLAAAAVLVIGIAAGLVYQRSAPSDNTLRSSEEYRIESLVPREASLPRDAFRLRWTAGPAGSRYAVRVTTEDLRVLATASDLAVPELGVESAQLSSVTSGARVFWQVDVTLPGGERVSSQTFVVQLQ
jgi:hypothetical protein